MAEKSAAQTPAEPFLFPVSSCRQTLPCGSEPTKTTGEKGDENDECYQSSSQANRHILVGQVPHVPSPTSEVLVPQKPPVAEVSNAVVDEVITMISRRRTGQVDASDEGPNRTIHNHVEGHQHKHQSPTKYAHFFPKTP